ncbi:uncharacterized protein TM35_000301750 [Trypanosoma theileri]|uniref:Uncharacterized protein n=1 Tax=Trypanosoma theileri TaxID=67003 RepID=A0A1X0NN42_9TRYP|nr:uncharacterized protein TM35_000301750 [Trypanosoma theileri]ORC86135.1 hypothetical protein TM35_000301750 [Trypanosoma theileri]
MFVQLRRVMYLLVLLQCCVCVAYVANANEVEQVSSNDESTKAKKVDQLVKAIEKAFERIMPMSGCLSLIRKNMELYKKNYKHAEAARKNITALDEEIKVLKGRKEKAWKPEEWEQEKRDGVQQDIYIVGNATLTLNGISQMEKACRNVSVDLGEEIKGLVNAREGFLVAHKNKTPDEIKLEKKSNETEGALVHLNEYREDLLSEFVPLMEVAKSMYDALDAIRGSLGDEATHVMSTEKDSEEEHKKRIGEIMNNFNEKLKEENSKANEEMQGRAEEEQDEKGRGSITEVKPTEATEETKGVGENAQKPPEEGEEKKEDEEDEKKNTKGKEEGKGREGEEEKAGEGDVTKEEGKKEREGEEAENYKNKEETKQEQEKQTNEEAKEDKKGPGAVLSVVQGADSSHSPAMVHSSLLLVLLYVLGCTLVC